MKFHGILEDLLSSRVKLAVIKLLMRHPGKKFSGRELARLVGLSSSRTLEILKLFQQYGIVNKITIGRTGEWSLNRKSFIIGQLAKVIAIDTKALEDLKLVMKKVLVQDKKVLRAVLFGSIAQGKERPNSDIDLFILVNAESDKAAAADRIHKLNMMVAPKYGNAVSAVIYSKDEYRKKRPLELMKQIEMGGVVLFER